MDNVEDKEKIIEEDYFDWGEDIEWDTNTDGNKADDVFADFDWEGDNEWENSGANACYANNENDLYYLEGYGMIYELEQLESSVGVIELLEHAKSDEQFNYILGMSNEKAYDDALCQYLIDKDYDIEQYCSINMLRIFKFKSLFMYFFNKALDSQKMLLAEKAQFMAEPLAEFLASKVVLIPGKIDWETSLKYHLDDELVVQKIIDFYTNNPDKKNFNFVSASKLTTSHIRQLINLGYAIDESSPFSIINNDEIMKEQFLKRVKITNPKFFNELERSVANTSGAYGKLFCIKDLDMYDDSIIETLGLDYFFQILKYILLSDYNLDLSRVLRSGRIDFIKLIYDELSVTDDFDIKLFINIVSKYNLNEKFISSITEKDVNDYREELKFLFEHKDINVSSLEELKNIRNIFHDGIENKIEKASTAMDLKSIITYLLTKQTYWETKKGNCEIWSKDKLKVLKNSILNEKMKKYLDSYWIFSDFFEDMDRINDVALLQILARTINRKVSQKGFNDKWVNINDKVIDLYNFEFNEKMTDFSKYLSNQTFEASSYIFKDGIDVKGKRVKVAHIKSGEEFNSLIHVLNAYQKSSTDGAVESLIHPILVGQSYLCVTGISDEYNRICVRGNSMHNPKFNLKILYSHIPSGSLFHASNCDTGIDSCNNSKDIYAKIPRNMMPFRRLVRNTEVHGSEAYNEIDVYRDNLVPSGIAFMGQYPTEDEINIAAYLDVPLVKIDDLQETFKQDAMRMTPLPDSEFYHIKDHEYENKEIMVSSNDSYDEMLSFLKLEMDKKEMTNDISVIDVLAIKDEVGLDEYVASVKGDDYEVTPLYDLVDSKRHNTTEIEAEECSLISKISNILQIDSCVEISYCKYPNGKIALGILNKKNNETNIDKWIKYLVLGRDFSEEMPLGSQERLKRLIDLSDEDYLALFNNLFLVSDYVESKEFINNVLIRRNKVKNMLMSKMLESEFDLEIPKLKNDDTIIAGEKRAVTK